MDGTKTTTNWIIAGLVALVVIIGGGWLIARERSGTMAGADATSTDITSSTTETANTETSTETSNTTNTTKTTGTKTTNPTTVASGETVTVSDQPAGSSVTVAEINISKPTWVAVRDSRPWYLGWKFLKAGEKDIVVPLQRSTVAGESYEVVLFTDDGNGSFEIHGGDALVTSSTGAPVSSTFKAQ
jgi:hypothetical protein